MPAGQPGSADLASRRDQALRPRASAVVKSPRGAERFLERLGIVLRYGSARTLPLGSMFDATSGGASKGPFIAAAELTNHLLGAAIAIEVPMIARRLTLVHRSLMPALYTLVRRGRAIDDLTGISMNARRALSLLQARREITAGDVRSHLGARFDARSDPANEALGELSSLLLVDRGPYEINPKGIHYLSKDGYPYHLFHAAHPELVRASAELTAADAADAFLARYLAGAVFCSVRTMKAMFKLLMVPEEIDASLARLSSAGTVRSAKYGGHTVACVAH